MKLIRTLTICLTLALAPTTSWAHSGRTDSAGCHTDSRTGSRHCHGGGGASRGGGGASRGGDGLSRGGVVALVTIGGLTLIGLIALAAAMAPESVSSLPEPEAPEDDELVWGLDGWAAENSGGVILQIKW